MGLGMEDVTGAGEQETVETGMGWQVEASVPYIGRGFLPKVRPYPYDYRHRFVTEA